MATTVDNFLGVNNLRAPEALVEIDRGRAKSFLTEAVNVDVTETFALKRRTGFTLHTAGEWHSIWANRSATVGLGVCNGTLYSVTATAATSLGLSVGSQRLAYAEISQGDIHISNGVSHWVYSGGAITELAQGGTYENTAQFLDQSEDDAFYDSFPPAFELEWAFGRLWGADADTIWYSPAFFPRRCKLDTDFIPFAEATLLKAVADGVYVGNTAEVWFFAGTDPKRMNPRKVSTTGAVRGTGLVVAGEKLAIDGLTGDVVLWESAQGKMLGTAGGRVTPLTEGILSYATSTDGASLLREAGGLTQHISTFAAPSGEASNMRATDIAVAEVRRNGVLI